MKKLILILFVLGVSLVTVSMFGKHTRVDNQSRTFIETSNLGISDTLEDNGL